MASLPSVCISSSAAGVATASSFRLNRDGCQGKGCLRDPQGREAESAEESGKGDRGECQESFWAISVYQQCVVFRRKRCFGHADARSRCLRAISGYETAATRRPLRQVQPKIHNRYVLVAYAAIAERLMYEFTDEFVASVRQSEAINK